MQELIRSKKEIYTNTKIRRQNYLQFVVLLHKWRLCHKIFIIAVKPVFADPRCTFFLALYMLVMSKHIMQYLLRCNADSKNT